jgi:hypothetical protein
MSKVIIYNSAKKTCIKKIENNENIEDATKKISNDKIMYEKKSYLDLVSKVSTNKVNNEVNDMSASILNIYDNYTMQLVLIQKLYNNTPFNEDKYFIRALKYKLDCYKQQDIKKTYDSYNNFITLENIIEKLAASTMLCYYCNVKTLILFKNSREQCQWTLDRINNYDEHSNSNTIICCLKCNLQRRRKNSAKFKFSKQLEHNLIVLKKLT